MSCSETTLKPKSGRSRFKIIVGLGLLAIIAGILFFPDVRIGAKPHRIQAVLQLHQIARAYAEYTIEQEANIRVIGTYDPAAGTISEDPREWAAVLAWHTDLYDATVYFIRRDQGVPSPRPTLVGQRDEENRTVIIDAAFKDLSVAVVANLPISPGHPLPVVWSVGLDPETGRWKEDSPFGTSGGVIAFTDGSSRFYSDLRGSDGEGLLPHYETGEPTFRIQEAIGPDAIILSREN